MLGTKRELRPSAANNPPPAGPGMMELSTMSAKPAPPMSWARLRKNSNVRGARSGSMTDSPVVVNPLTDSNSARWGRSLMVATKGMAPKAITSSQTRTTTTAPSGTLMVWLAWREWGMRQRTKPSSPMGSALPIKAGIQRLSAG